MRQVAVCKFLVVLAACLVPLLPLAASAQAVPGGGGDTQATTNGGASTGTMLAAALETAGYQSQQQILQQLSTHLGMLSALVFLCVIVSAVFSFAVSGGSMRTVWLLLGPPIFMFVSGIELNGYKNRTQASGVEWAFGTFKDVNNDKDKILQPVNINTKSDVSFVFHKYNEFVSETVQMLVAVITDQDMLPQMTFMARQRVMDDLFAFDINDPHWQSLMAYFMVRQYTGAKWGRHPLRPRGWVGYFFSESRISRNSTMSSGVGAGAAGAGVGSDRFRRLICFTIMKMMKARIVKLTATVMKLP